MTDRTVTLSHDECEALALRLVARHVYHDPEMVADWEHVPSLDEQSWLMVQDAIQDIARDLRQRSDRHDQAVSIDSQHLLERAS